MDFCARFRNWIHTSDATDFYGHLSPDSKKTVRNRIKNMLTHLEQLAKEDEGKAKRELFKGSSAGAGSSSQAVTTPKKKKCKRENAFVPSPDGGLAADHPDRDGKRSSAAVYVDTPPKKQGKAKLADRF